MIEIDGPKKAWFEAPNGDKYIYTVYAIMAKTEYECMMAYANWRLLYEDNQSILVWRMRPELSQHNSDSPDDEPIYKMVCRCVKVSLMPYHALVVKPEGEAPIML
jgi:hypothetical protein